MNRAVALTRSGSPDLSRAIAIAPVGAAIASPYLMQVLSYMVVVAHGSPSPNGMALWVAVAGSLVVAALVMASGFAAVRIGAAGGRGLRAGVAGHLAFATPSLFVGFGNVANLLQAPAIVSIGWPLFWAAMAALVLSPVSTRTGTARIGPLVYRRVAMAHGFSALAILTVFLAPHLANHVSGLWSGMAHIEIMKTARQIYRNAAAEPVLIALIAFQIGSGAFLAQRRLRSGGDFFAVLQTMTGGYVGIYFLAHLTAVFGARAAGTDTNWNWLTNNDHSMLASLSNLRLIGHYWFGPVAVATHLGCGLRGVLREHSVSARLADFTPRAAMAAGMVISSAILVALLGTHLV